MSDEQKKLVKARLDEVKGIMDWIKEVLDEDDEDKSAQQQQEGPSDPPPNPPGGGNG